MSRVKIATGLAAFAAAVVLWTSCAPVDTGSPGGTSSPQPKRDSTAPVSPPQALPPDGLQKRVELAIQQVRDRHLLTSNGFWTVFHGILGLGPSIMLYDEKGQPVNAIEYIRTGHEVRGMEFIPMGDDGLEVETGREQFVSQGHPDQFVAEMAEWGLPGDTEFLVDGKKYKFLDFARWSKARARVKPRPGENLELSWTIVVLADYFGTKLEWRNRDDEPLQFEDLVRFELDQPIETSETIACGGTHRLFGLMWVYYVHLREDAKPTGVWAEIPPKMAKYQQLARKYQNRDGSFSTNFFRGPGDVTRELLRAQNKQEWVQLMKLRINTTGHILEWLALSLSDAELREPWVQDAVNSLTMMFLDIQDSQMEGGAMYHAVHALILYHARVYGTDWLGPNAPLIPLPGKTENLPRRSP